MRSQEYISFNDDIVDVNIIDNDITTYDLIGCGGSFRIINKFVENIIINVSGEVDKIIINDSTYGGNRIVNVKNARINEIGFKNIRCSINIEKSSIVKLLTHIMVYNLTISDSNINEYASVHLNDVSIKLLHSSINVFYNASNMKPNLEVDSSNIYKSYNFLHEGYYILNQYIVYDKDDGIRYIRDILDLTIFPKNEIIKEYFLIPLYKLLDTR